MNPNFNEREEYFMARMMKPLALSLSSPIYYLMAIKVINQQLLNPMNSKGGNSMLMSIASKIAYAQMSEEIDSILSEVEEVDIERKESTRVESMKIAKVNSTRGHILIKAALTSSSEPLSRTDLANLTNLRVSAVCGRVKELLEEGVIKVVATKWDTESKRKVEILELV